MGALKTSIYTSANDCEKTDILPFKLNAHSMDLVEKIHYFENGLPVLESFIWFHFDSSIHIS